MSSMAVPGPNLSERYRPWPWWPARAPQTGSAISFGQVRVSGPAPRAPIIRDRHTVQTDLKTRLQKIKWFSPRLKEIMKNTTIMHL